MIADEGGRSIWEADYYAFGQQFSTSLRDDRFNYGFTGKEFDPESGLNYHGARFLDSKIGRFLQVDPLSVKYPAESPYHYCSNNPIMYIDPDGKEYDPAGAADDIEKHAELVTQKSQEFIDNNIDDNNIIGYTAATTVNDCGNFCMNLFISALANVLRLGTGTGTALFDDNASLIDRSLGVGADLLRLTEIVGTVGGIGIKVGGKKCFQNNLKELLSRTSRIPTKSTNTLKINISLPRWLTRDRLVMLHNHSESVPKNIQRIFGIKTSGPLQTPLHLQINKYIDNKLVSKTYFYYPFHKHAPIFKYMKQIKK